MKSNNLFAVGFFATIFFWIVGAILSIAASAGVVYVLYLLAMYLRAHT